MPPKLDEWSLLERTGATGLMLSGRVRGHPELLDGKQVLTSRLIKLRDGFAITENNTYELGRMDPVFESTLHSRSRASPGVAAGLPVDRAEKEAELLL